MDDEAIVNVVPAKFDYFQEIARNEVTESRLTDRVNPVSGHEGRHGGSLKFFVKGTDQFFHPSESFIYLKLKLVGTDSNQKTPKLTDLAATQLSVVNLIPHSIFQSVKVKVGNQIITYNDNDYPYKTLIQMLFNSGKESLETYFRTAGFIKDVSGHMDAAIDTTDVNKTENTALLERRKKLFSANDAVGEFIIKPHTGICFSEKAIPPYLDVEFELVRNERPDFYLMSKTSNFHIEILESYFMPKKYNASLIFLGGLEKALTEHKLLKLQLNEPCVTTFTLHKDQLNYHNETLFNGKIPIRIIIGLVDAKAYQGDKTKNPFNFQHFKRTHIRLLRNAAVYPDPEIVTSFADVADQSCMLAYHHLYSSFNATYNRDVPIISYEDFSNGYFLTAYNMAPDEDTGLDPYNAAYKPSSIRLELRFGAPIPDVTQMIVYYEVINQVMIDYKRTVSVIQQ